LHYVGLTYLEELEYAALLRLSGHISYKHRARELLQFFGLMDKAHTLIPEDVNRRGEIGAELRLLTFAVELITNCPVVVIDDPLRDVDSAYQHRILGILQTLSREGHTVICSLSDPQPFSFDALDSLILLGENSLIYSGKRAHAREYFSSLGIVCPDNVHLSDFLTNISRHGANSDLNVRAYTPADLAIECSKRCASEASTGAAAYDDNGPIRWWFRSSTGFGAALAGACLAPPFLGAAFAAAIFFNIAAYS
jgi:ABC-type multidrug transport system ATPase subunit